MRRFWQLTLMVLLAISFAQVAWWLVDQANYTGGVKQTLTELYAQDVQLPNSERLNERGLNLPLHPRLEAPDVERIIDLIGSFGQDHGL